MALTLIESVRPGTSDCMKLKTPPGGHGAEGDGLGLGETGGLMDGATGGLMGGTATDTEINIRDPPDFDSDRAPPPVFQWSDVTSFAFHNVSA